MKKEEVKKEEVKKEEECCLSRFIVAVARLILDGVCKHGSLGCLKYKGGPRTVCSKCKEDVLLPLVTSDRSCSASDIEKAEMDCPNCNMNTINVNNVLSEVNNIALQRNRQLRTNFMIP